MGTLTSPSVCEKLFITLGCSPNAAFPQVYWLLFGEPLSRLKKAGSVAAPCCVRDLARAAGLSRLKRGGCVAARGCAVGVERVQEFVPPEEGGLRCGNGFYVWAARTRRLPCPA